MLEGVAWSGGSGNRIQSVELSVDDGKHWYPAKLLTDEGKPASRQWAWTTWTFAMPPLPSARLPLGAVCIVRYAAL